MQSISDREAVLFAGPDAGREPLYQRLGELTRTLHEALRELGYDRHIEEAVTSLPEARSRLSYISKLTGDAAEKVLNAVDCARAGQDALLAESDRVHALLAGDPAGAGPQLGEFVGRVRGHCAATNGHLTEIMMAQDFHDLTGQVTRRLVEMVQRLEADLLALLIEATPRSQRPAAAGALDGPVVEPAGRDDVVADQQQVDDLLESLGF